MTRVGTIAFATRQGIGWLPKWFRDNGVIQETMVFRHGSRKSHAVEWYGLSDELVGRPFNGPLIDEFLDRIEVLLFFETPFDWTFLDYARKRGVKSAIVVMHECCPERRPFEPDLWICPSLLDQRDYFPTSPFLEVPVTLGTWRQRTTATRWLHNGANLGLRHHKGTPEILRAMHLLTTRVDMTIRAQDESGLASIMRVAGWDPMQSVHELPCGGRMEVITGDGEYDKLYSDHDVFIMAEKYNGLSLPLREARAAGMLVITSKRFPMTEWLPNDPLIPVASYSRQRVGGPYYMYDEAHVEPEAIAATIDAWNNRDIAEYSRGGLEWAEAHSWAKLRPAWVKVLEELTA